MYKLCFSTLACMDCDAKKLKELCDKFGLDAVEIRQKKDGSFVYDEKLNITDIGTGVCLKGYDKNQISAAKEVLEKIKDTSVKAIRIFLGNFAVMKNEKKDKLDYDGIVMAVREIADSTKKQIWIESHNEFSTGEVLKKLLCDVKRDNVFVIWDVMHPFEDGEPVRKTWEYIGKYVAHVHIKDGKKSCDIQKHDFDYTDFGEGEVPVREVLEILKENNYNAYISAEWEGASRKELENCDNRIESVLERFVNFIKK